MSSTVIPGVPEDIQLITGPLLLGYLFNWGLFGILVLQVYIYYLSFPNDSRVIKSLVYGLFFVDCVQTALTTHNAWHFLSKGWGDLRVLSDPGWSWIAVPLLSGIVSSTVQLFFAWRIWVLSKSIPLAGLIVAIAIAQGLCAMYSVCYLNDITQIATLFPSATVWLGGSALCDFIITISMVTFLARASTGFSQTDSVITKLIRMTVETGLKNNLHMIPALALAKLYTNTLLATFNSRSVAFGGSTSRTDAERSTQYGGNEWRRPTQTTTKDRVQITTVRETHADDTGVQMERCGTSDVDEEDNVSKHTFGLGSGPDSYPYLGSQKDIEAQH
ncbi:hypothetical protein RhiXN_06572 [Rhizoctonia solani]|uniref:DUF6534 domain-containing protein n=1 Tax=Rhizoctonia solani TaxID=456999 RepID=A0A8H8SYQ4_9AGAM|nr:uncharacterized protein RhiXN_06572 [Rhizoctonia solani]QRW21583.1 hypothetical protein RhiXN_06572 [Rhizoctonia solani]